MAKTIERKKGFEVHKSDDKSVVFKRVIPSRGRKPKEVHRVELSLPKVKMIYFTDQDLKRLNDIEEQISRSYKKSSKGRFVKVYEEVKKFMID